MDAFETTPLDGMALSGQDPLMGSIWNSAAAWNSNAGLTGVLHTMQATASRGDFTPELEEPLPTVADQSEPDFVTKLFSRSTSATEGNNRLLTQDSLTGIAEGAAIAGSDDSDFLVEDVTSVNGEAVLNLAVVTAQEQLESFATNEAFLDKMNLAFGEDIRPKEAHALTQDLANGEAMPEIAVLPAADLKANGAFGEETIYLSEEFLSENIINPEAVAGVLLEEIGHYVDQELGSGDSPGDEGDIFARLAQGEAIGGAELTALKAESDSETIALNGAEIAVELDASEPAPLEPVSIAAIDYQDTAPPDHLLKYEPGVPLVKDPAVEKWQQRMKDLGYDIAADGLYGEQSKEVAIAFQQEKGLADDGVVGPDTWAATFSANASEPASIEPVSIAAIDYQDKVTATAPPDHLLKYEPGVPLVKDPAVEQWQQRMKDLGYDIAADGLYGEQSKEVAIAFQQEKGLADDGIVGELTWKASFTETPPSVDPPQPEVPTAPLLPAGEQSPVSGDIDGFDLDIWRYDTGGRSTQEIEPGKDTVLITHGWKGSDQDDAIEELAKEASEDDVQVLALDWSSIAQAGLDSSDYLPPYNTAKWIAPVAAWAQDKLEALHINPNQLTLVGHSLGAYVSSEIAGQFGQVKNLVALDPAFPGINSLLDGYDVDKNTDGQQLPADFHDVATNSLAFVAGNSNPIANNISGSTSDNTSFIGGIAGDSDKAASAHDSFVIQFPSGEVVNNAHTLVVDVFTDALDGHLKLPDLALPPHEDSWYTDNGNKLPTSVLPDLINSLLDLNHHEGRISATSTGEIEELTVVVDSSGTEDTPWT